MRMLLALLVLALCWAAPAEAKAPRAGREVAVIANQAIVVYTYKPAPCEHPRLLVVFAGHARNADRYRDHASGLAERACLWVVAPLLDRNRFPNWRYQFAGVSHDNRIQPRSEWTGPLAEGLITWGRNWTGQPAMPYILFGHSAGAQFLSRISAYMPPPGASRIVIANPSAHVWPSLNEQAPYGFAGLFDPANAQARLRAYLALPITIYLGGEDTGDKLLVNDAPARRQGANRHERGLNVFSVARRESQSRAWTFGWRLVEVDDSGHSARDMLDAPEAMEALGLTR